MGKLSVSHRTHTVCEWALLTETVLGAKKKKRNADLQVLLVATTSLTGFYYSLGDFRHKLVIDTYISKL